MGVRVKVTMDDRRVESMIHKFVSEGTRKAADKTRTRVRENIVQSGRVNTGAMLNSVTAKEKINTGVRCTWTVSTDRPYAMYQEKGIGPVYPVRAKALRFKPKGAAGFVFAKSTRGFQGAHFMRDAYRAIRASDWT